MLQELQTDFYYQQVGKQQVKDIIFNRDLLQQLLQDQRAKLNEMRDQMEHLAVSKTERPTEELPEIQVQRSEDSGT